MKIINAIHAQCIGGVDQVFRDYSEALVKQGHDVTLLISDNGNDNFEDLGAKRIVKLKNSAQILDFLHLLFLLIFLRPDLIICHSRRLMSWSKTLRFFYKIKLIKTKSVAINHGISFHKSLCCDYVVSINEDIRNMVVAEGFDRDKTFTLPNAIKITQKYHEKTLKNPPTLGIYGRVEYRKGFHILIAACELLKKQGRDFILKIGGFEIPNSDRSWKNIDKWIEEADIAEKCRKVGVVVDKQKFFEDVDIFCVPSREEPFGIVILEGFLHSTLVISSATVGGKLLIENGKNGILCKIDDAEDLAKKLIEVLDQPNAYSFKTKNAFLRLEKEFSSDSLGHQMSKILQKISTNV